MEFQKGEKRENRVRRKIEENIKELGKEKSSGI